MSILDLENTAMERKTGISLFDCLSAIDDLRQPSNGTLHDFREMLVMMIVAVHSDCEARRRNRGGD